MAFHVACPITCRKICYCTLGFPRLLRTEEGKDGFLADVGRIEEFLKDPWRRRGNDGEIVQVKVPKVVVVDLPIVPPGASAVQIMQQKKLVIDEVGLEGKEEDVGGGELDEMALANASAQTKRLVLQKKAAATSEMVEDLARRFEAGDVVGEGVDFAGGEKGQLSVKIMCRLCLSGENDGTERARKMLPCKSCGKKYHRSCVKSWSQNRDLFHWSSWTCPSCRICEVCCRMGDPNKFMFCRRCDAAYHCYCQQPPHKNVSSGPYLCPKHTRCHSCASSVPGNGTYVRWFLGHTCCDACGRLFVKGNYCPVCLKVYRDSESTPMVCCDVCQRWVHCQCDGISNEKYMEFQVDGNLQYACPTCRGECCQVRNPEEAVVELWRRRDEADRDLIASLREAAGLPTQEETFTISPFSDDEDNGHAIPKNEYGRSIKFSLKGLVEKSPRKIEHGKKSSNKKSGKKKGKQSSVTGKIEAHQHFDGHTALPSSAYSVGGRNKKLSLFQISEPETSSFPVSGRTNEKLHFTNQTEKRKSEDEVVENSEGRTSRMVPDKSNTPSGGQLGPSAKGPKLVIHLGSRNKNSTDSPRSDASSSHKEPATSNGSEDVGHIVDMRVHATASKFEDEKGDKVGHIDQLKGSKSKIKIRKSNPDVTDKSPMFGSVSTPGGHSQLGRGVGDGSIAEAKSEVQASRGSKLASREGHPNVSGVSDDINNNNPAASNLLSKDFRPLLKLKFKKPNQENQVSWINQKDDEMSLPKGQRSKRKRPSPSRERASAEVVRGSAMDEIMDANWILQKLGNDAVGKRVEVHQPTDNSWQRGTVVEVFEGTSVISVKHDGGKSKNLELGKQGIRFVSQKQRR